MAQADSKNIRKRPTEAELARAFGDLESAMHDLQNMASVCSAIAEDAFQEGARNPAPNGLKTISDDAYVQTMFCISHLEDMIQAVAKRYFEKAYPGRSEVLASG